MKINDIQTKDLRARVRSAEMAQNRPDVKANAKEAQARAGGDRVDLSPEASSLASSIADVAASATMGADPLRVAEIKDAIKSGSFPLDIRRLAEAIVREELGD